MAENRTARSNHRRQLAQVLALRKVALLVLNLALAAAEREGEGSDHSNVPLAPAASSFVSLKLPAALKSFAADINRTKYVDSAERIAAVLQTKAVRKAVVALRRGSRVVECNK
jgi:hypothetical protein